MTKLSDIIANLDYKKTKEDTIEIIDGEFIIEILFDKFITLEDNFPDTKHIIFIVIKNYNEDKKKVIWKLYSTLNFIYSYLNIIPKYFTKVDKNKTLSFFEIILYPQYLSFDFFAYLSNKHPAQWFHNENYFINSSVEESGTINILLTNTKARRLGYLKLIIEMFNKSSYYPTTYLNKKVEDNSLLYVNDLLEYGTDNKGDNKGLIKKTSTGASAKPYVDLLEEMDITVRTNNSYILSKQSKIYFHLNNVSTENQDEISTNVFEFGLLDKMFFLRQILITDSLYIWSIIDIIFIAQKPISTLKIKEVFVNYVIAELERNQQFSENNTNKRKIMEIISRIEAWKSPIVYLEHIIEPRVNWLVDLRILELKSNSKEKKYSLTKVGRNLFAILSQIYSSNFNKQLVLQSFISKNYMGTFAYIYEIEFSRKDWDFDKIESYILEAFKLFKTNAPNRIAASQGIDYVCFQSFLKDGVIIEFDDLRRYLQNNHPRFILDWFKTENDGTIYIKKLN
ncbi:hypothetical protein [Chryseobacterium sp. JUb7]|uniref:hypothetical protein n=1 Tax=Chryseobacterium sp. JUb7 TaxID=2940599 RepID=UPI00216A8A47|nr:hypothetical protein [Chryseobacterium sp. JUb7]MCS3532853.1 putative transcriptional regulator [Chryseobacterium sp. JUb7]